MARKRARTPLSPRKLPTQERARRTYRAILEAGARILERQGYEALTTNHVADLAGVGIASLYEYFPNKHALVAEIVRFVLDELLADLAGVGIASLYEYFPNKHALVAEIVRFVLDELLADLGASTRLVATAPPDAAMKAWLGSMYAAVAKRRGVVKVIVQEVPFLWEIPAVDHARTLLLELARSMRDLDAEVRRTAPMPDAMIYLLATMTGAAVLEAVLRPPAAHAADELIATRAEIVARVTGPAQPRPATGAGRRPR